MAGNLTAMIASIFSGGVTPDPYYPYTTLLLPGNGTNGAQNNTFLDGSTNNFTITRNGNTTQGTFSPFSQTGWGNYFNGSNQLTLPSALAIAPEAGQFCIEFWIYPTALWGSVDRPIFVTAGTGGLWVGWQSTAFVLRAYGVTNHLTYATAPTLNTWTHVAICRNSGNTTSMYFNGSRVATGTVTQNFAQAVSYIASDTAYGGGGAALLMASNLSNLRLVKGAAVYDPTLLNIPVPTAPLTAISGTSLLTCQSNRFLDNSSNAFAITANGSPTVVAFSPFNPTASWSAATYGGSGYFDGNLDYLTAPNNAAFAALPGDFTLELWVYLTAQTTGNALFGPWAGSAGSAANSSWLFTQGTTSASNLRFVYSNGSSVVIYEGSGGLGTNQWFHLVAVRSGTNFALFSNGNRVYSNASVSASIPQNTSNLGVMAGADGAFASTGYVSSARVVKGTAVYDPTLTTLTVPTAPLTAITNTSLLLNFTNAGIYDATSKNDLETVGNAQISTAISAKWGTGSIKFNGTTDYLDIPPSTLIDLGGGDWTFEGWVYPASLPAGGSTSAIVTLANPIVGGYAALRLRINSSGTLELYISTNGSTWSTYGTSSAGISAGQWSHVAVVRSGSGANNVQLYINGTSRLSLSLSGTPYSGGKYVIGCTFSASAATEFWNGYMQDLRLTKGYARTITASPTAAFPTL